MEVVEPELEDQHVQGLVGKMLAPLLTRMRLQPLETLLGLEMASETHIGQWKRLALHIEKMQRSE